MNKINLDYFISKSIKEIINNLNLVFNELIQEIKLYINLELVYSDVEVDRTKSSNDLIYSTINFGVKKTYYKELLSISIFNNYNKFIHFILLKEAYKCFIPVELQENEIINVFINQKVEIDLQNSIFIADWSELRRKSVINYEFMEKELDKLEKFLRQESTKNRPSPFKYLFLYIRKNLQTIIDNKDGLYGRKNFFDLFFEDYVCKFTEYNDYVLEAIRILTEIFNKAKSYSSILDYKQLFKEFIESGAIQTSISFRKFTESMQWIKNYSQLAPSYFINWPALNILSTICILKFHPIIEPNKIIRIISQLPFFLTPQMSRENFGVEIIGFFLFPKMYLNDLINFLENLESVGYLIDKKLFIINKFQYTTNLNHYRNFLRRFILLNPNKRGYKSEYEISVKIDYGQSKLKLPLSLLDWLIIDRIQYYSITGLGFERRSETLNTLKQDILNIVQSEANLIKEIKKILNQIYKSQYLTKISLDLINNNKKFGFFYIKQKLYDYITVFELIDQVKSQNPSISNLIQFQKAINSQKISKTIETRNLLIKLKSKILEEAISLILKSEKNFKERVENYRILYNLFKLFFSLKLFSLDTIISIISNNSLIQKIYQPKEQKLKNYYESYKSYKITYQVLEQKLEDFINVNPPIIQPSLLNTIAIANITSYFPVLILKDSLQTREGIEKLKWFFPRVIIVEILEYKTEAKFIYLRLQLPYLQVQEKQLLYSILFNIFQKNLICLKAYNESGFQESFSRKDFYNLEKQEFFYSKGLFEQFYLYILNIFNYDVDPISETTNNIKEDFWAKNRKISHLINHFEYKISKDHVDLASSNLNNLFDYYNDLEKQLLNLEKFKYSKNEYFFKNYIKIIKFIPSFQCFGFGQYFLYFFPLDLNEIDFKHFLHNSFQKIKYPANIDNSNSFLINFIWPYRNPNISLLNWLTKSKRVIREYCLFFIKKIFQIFHFNYNLSVNEWDLDPNRFKTYFQNVLFNPDYKLTIPEFKEFNIGDLNISNCFSPGSKEFKALTQLYSWRSIDIKSYLGTRNYTMVNAIIELLEKKLIFPFISVKNLDLIEKLYIILPDVNKEHNEKLQKIFSFFNIGFIYEIEGEYYIHGMSEEIKFENGLLIKLYLPDCQLDEFEKLFDLIFEYLGIKHYVISNDLVDGKDFLKSIYVLKSYNPLKNLIWNDKDKMWRNHKLFDNKFRKIYPSLFPNDN